MRASPALECPHGEENGLGRISDYADNMRFAIGLWREAATTPELTGTDEVERFVLDRVPTPAVEEYLHEPKVKFSIMPVREFRRREYLLYRAMGRGKLRAKMESGQVVGTFAPGLHEIFISAGIRRSVIDYPHSWKGAADVLGHEFGHFVDCCCLGASSRPDFVAVWERERHLMDSYARDDVSEYFADMFWICCRYGKLAEEHAPETASWFRRFFEGCSFGFPADPAHP